MAVTRSQSQAQEAPIAGFPDPRTPPSNSTPSASRTRPLGARSNPELEIPYFSEIEVPDSDEPPVYTIDLSLPPSQRYVALAQAYKPQLLSLTSLFDEVIESAGISNVELVRSIARLVLRGLHSKEQTEEIRGIAKVVGVDMYLLVAFNTLLDLFMGCSSGGARVRDGDGSDASTARMLHFRTLDWEMDELREIVVTLEYVEKAGGPVIARGLTYVGFVGVLTAVRQGLSLSLNFRPNHDSSSPWKELRFRGHQLLMLLGYRPSISSILRSYIIPSTHRNFFTRKVHSTTSSLPSLETLTKEFPSVPSAAAYVIASDGKNTTVFEKDRTTATIRSSPSFIIATNHDESMEPAILERAAQNNSQDHHPEVQPGAAVAFELKLGGSSDAPDLLDLLYESVDRSSCVAEKWKAERKFRHRNRGAAGGEAWVRSEKMIQWLQEYPTTNEMTHFACVMDPAQGRILWVRRWLEPVVQTDSDDDSPWEGDERRVSI